MLFTLIIQNILPDLGLVECNIQLNSKKMFSIDEKLPYALTADLRLNRTLLKILYEP